MSSSSFLSHYKTYIYKYITISLQILSRIFLSFVHYFRFFNLNQNKERKEKKENFKFEFKLTSIRLLHFALPTRRTKCEWTMRMSGRCAIICFKNKKNYCFSSPTLTPPSTLNLLTFSFQNDSVFSRFLSLNYEKDKLL